MKTAEVTRITTINLAYGRGEASLELPSENLLGVYLPKVVEAAQDEAQLIRAALAAPNGTRRLRDLAGRGKKVVIVTSDMTRPCPSARLFPFILEELAAAGVPDEDVTIVMALGLHRPMTEAEIAEALSPQISSRFRVLNHDVNDTVRLGVTREGTPVEIFRPVVEADLRVCLGNVEFHYFAGYSGGAKAIFPGCASRAGVTANHAMMVRPGSGTGRLVGNPVRADIEEAAGMLGVDFVLNVVVDGDHRVVGAAAGDMIAAQRKGCELVAERGVVKVLQQADIVVASAGGYPKDVNLYQAQKALDNAVYFGRKGGAVILLAECPEGFGNRTFQEWIRSASSLADVLDRVRREFALGGHKAAAIAAVAQRNNIYLVSGMADDDVRACMMTPFRGAQEAFDAALEEMGPQSRVAVLPQAGSVVAEVVE